MTVPIIPSTNVSSFRLAPGYSKHAVFEQEAGVEDDDDPLGAVDVQATDPSLVTDDEMDNKPEEDEWDWNEGWKELEPKL